MVTTTIGNRKQATALATSIVEARLAACVQQGAIQSVYRWKGKMDSGKEILLSCKTRAALAPALLKFIRAQHPYELPEIIVTPITDGLPAYLAWIRKETR